MSTANTKQIAKLWTVVEVCCYAVWSIIIILSVYTNIRLCKEKIWREMYIQKRSILSFYLLNISLIMAMISFCCTAFAFIHLYENHEMFALICAFAMASTWLLLFSLIIKNWMIYFKFKWTYYTIEMDWQYIINRNAVSIKRQQNWYIANNKKYGNLFYNYKLFGFLCFSGCVLCIIPTMFVVFSDFHIIPLILSLVAMFIGFGPLSLFYCYIVLKTPHLNDIYDIHSESKIHAKLLILLVIALFIMNIFFVIFQDFRAYFIGGFVLSFILFAMNYISTVTLPRNQNKKKELHTQRISHVNTMDVTLERILTNRKAMHWFMIHLSKEYSMEILLSYIEFTQFQQSIRHCINEEILKSTKLIDFAAKIPISEIVEKKEESKDGISSSKIKAHALFNKYVRVGSPFEINISSAHRKELGNILSDSETLLLYNVTFDDLFMLFERAKQQMVPLQMFSLTRFRNSSDFTAVVGCLDD